MRADATYEVLVDEGVSAPFTGWDFSWQDGRISGDELPWNYASLAREAVPRATRVLDVDTGDGAFLAGLGPLPEAIATEPYPPNVPIASARLAPLGVDVRAGTGSALPVNDGDVDLVLNRHGSLDASEVAREEFPATRYQDVGAVVYQLRAVPWQVPGFDVDTFDARLRDIDAEIRKTGSFNVRSHRFLIRARKP
jgi:hypothetical protein